MITVNKNHLLYWMNVRKATPSHIKDATGINIEISGQRDIRVSQAQCFDLAKFLRIDVDRLTGSSHPKFIFMSASDIADSKRQIYRDNLHFYNYYDLPSPPGFVSPVILDILCPGHILPKLNEGHFEEAITLNLGPGHIYGRWDTDIRKPSAFGKLMANTSENDWVIGDSYYEPSFCPHSYSLVDDNVPARIISYTAHNPLISLKQEIAQLDTHRFDEFSRSAANGYCLFLLDSYRKSMLLSLDDFCDLVELSKTDYSHLSYPIEIGLAYRISRVLRIDPRMLTKGCEGGDSLGKEYMSWQSAVSNIRKFGCYQIASMASSQRAPDLKGHFIKVDTEARGSHLCFAHNQHYLVTGGSINMEFYSGKTTSTPSSSITIAKGDSIWVAPWVKHSFQGNGNLVLLMNGEGISNYLNHFALQNLWNTDGVLGRLLGEERAWGYDSSK